LHVGFTYALQINSKYYGHARLDMGPQFSEAHDRLVSEYQRQGMSAEDARKAAHDKMVFWGIEDGDLETKYDAKMEFSWPQQLGLGIAGKPTDALLLGLDAKWYQWSKTMDAMKMIVKRPNNRNAKHVLGSYKKLTELPADWDDQIVVAAGAQYEFVKGFWGRLGYNYGNNPVPVESASPIFPAQVEHHIAAGLGYRYDLFEVNGAYEYGLPNAVKVSDESSWGAEYRDSEFTQGSHDAKLNFAFTF
jgi:long-subunit fatty acid transport protein